MKKKRHGISLKKVITAIIIIQTVVFFALSFMLVGAKEISMAAMQTAHAMEEIKGFLPELSENEAHAKSRYIAFNGSRCTFLAKQMNEGYVDDEDTFEEVAELLGFTGAYVTDAKGKIQYFYGEEPHTTLPYDGGVSYETKEYGTIHHSTLKDEDQYLLFGVPLKQGRYLTVEIATDSFFQFLSDTFSLNEQLHVLAMSCDVNVFAISPKDHTIVSHEDPSLYGTSAWETPVPGTSLYVIQLGGLQGDVYFGCQYDDGEEIIAVTVSFGDLVMNDLAYALQFTLVVSFVIALIGRFVIYAVEKHVSTKKEFGQSLVVLSVMGLTVVFSFTCFWQALTKQADSFLRLKTLLAQNADAQKIYDKQSEEIYSWMSDQYLIQCRVAALEAAERGEGLTDEELKDLSEALDVEYIYVLDRNGKTIQTDSPYRHYTLRTDGDQSAAFRPLLEGVDHLVQDIMPDDVSGEKRQYIGVSIHDEDGDPDGCVLISLDPDQIDDLQNMINITGTLEYGLIGNADDVSIIDGNSLVLRYSTNKELVGIAAEDLKLTEEILKSGKLNIISYADGRDIVGSQVLNGGSLDGDYLVMSVHQTKLAGVVSGGLAATFFTFLTILIFAAIGMRCYKESTPEEEETAEENVAKEEESKAMEEMTEDERGFFVFSKLVKNNEKYQFEERWKMKRKTPEEMSVGELTRHSVRGYYVAFCILFLLPLAFHLLGFESAFSAVLGYVVNGNWANTLNIFTVAQCLLLICIMILLDRVIKRILYYIARLSPSRVETVCLLLRSALKYILAVIVIFYVLLKFGIDPAALLTSAGVLSVVIGFGAQHVTADILAGFFIIFERSFDVGDFVTIGDTYGIVKEIGLRTTKVRWYADVTVINNSEITKVLNQSGDVMRMIIPIRVRYETKLEELEALIDQALPEIGEHIQGLVKPPIYQGVNRFQDNGVDLRFALYTVGYQRMWVQRQFLREMKLFLEKNDIQIPYEQVVVRDESANACKPRQNMFE